MEYSINYCSKNTQPLSHKYGRIKWSNNPHHFGYTSSSDSFPNEYYSLMICRHLLKLFKTNSPYYNSKIFNRYE